MAAHFPLAALFHLSVQATLRCAVKIKFPIPQWRDELFEKFGLEFKIFSPLMEQASPSGNPFSDHQRLIVRLDQFSRNEELQEKICAAGWDLVVFDEAHKLAAHYFGSKLEKMARFRFAEKLGQHTRHLLLMTATPHNGKEPVPFDPLRENEVASTTLASSDDTRSVPATMKPKSMTMGERPAAVRLSCLTCRAVRILAFRSESLVISVKCLFINRGPV